MSSPIERHSSADVRPWRVAVFGDTHDRFPPGLPARLAVADELWHLGDVCDPATLVEFEQLGLPLAVVRGNNDWTEAWPLSLRLQRRGRVFHLAHRAASRPARSGVCPERPHPCAVRLYGCRERALAQPRLHHAAARAGEELCLAGYRARWLRDVGA